MKVLLHASILVLSISTVCLSQEPVPVLKASWERTTLKAPNPKVAPTVPAKPIIAENKNFQRNARAQRTDNPMDPYEASIEGRSAAMERAVQESRTPKADDVTGYHYVAEVRNDTGRTIEVIYWEYRFTEVARPENVVSRQFLCGVKVKNGAKGDLTAFSMLAPSDTIDAASLAAANNKLFTEHVQINRVEFSDGQILQRNGWNYKDVQDAVKRVTSTPWGRETCRVL
ncbi:MAG TPA: hypothetical protein VNA22_07945 [Pyrinomonadaceae bacterium]|nr:hypothetical protein [Pyrinomonadaceae bacterium]